jgi:hypothetical protein
MDPSSHNHKAGRTADLLAQTPDDQEFYGILLEKSVGFFPRRCIFGPGSPAVPFFRIPASL